MATVIDCNDTALAASTVFECKETALAASTVIECKDTRASCSKKGPPPRVRLLPPVQKLQTCGQGRQARLLPLRLEGFNDSCDVQLPAPPRPPPVRAWC